MSVINGDESGDTAESDIVNPEVLQSYSITAALLENSDRKLGSD